jgi:hypothetical protein
LRSCQLCSHSSTSQHFMEPEGSLPCSQEPSTCSYPETDQCNPYHRILSKIHFNTVTYVLVFLVVSFLPLSHQYPICIPPLPHSCYILCLCHPSRAYRKRCCKGRPNIFFLDFSVLWVPTVRTLSETSDDHAVCCMLNHGNTLV